jgi:DNA transposition AAA+ family ATPase
MTAFIETKQYRLFEEFCDACCRYQYIGVCYGSPGVGKTLSARHYANWDNILANPISGYCDDAVAEAAVDCHSLFYTVPVVITALQLGRALDALRDRVRLMSSPMKRLNDETDRLLTEARVRENREREEFFAKLDRSEWDWKMASFYDFQSKPTAFEIRGAVQKRREEVKDPTRLIIVDEADRLKDAAFEQIRHIFDRGGVGVVLIGMPGLEKRIARYPQLYSRVGFVHEFPPLSQSEIRELLPRLWPAEANLPAGGFANDEAIASTIRASRGNFRTLNRLLTQMGRTLEINGLQAITAEVVKTAREMLVVGNE